MGKNHKKEKRSSKMYSRDLRRRKEVTGSFPECGAIFMSNRSTLDECLERGLLGLPGSFSDFVRRVQAGMILFLFEHEERRLYGVFKAISDGGINLVPHAYTSSGRSYPAQVEFATIWHCEPLFEDEFRDAIRDNYFDTNKFNFGLSEDQVQSLLLLFNSRKVAIMDSHSEAYDPENPGFHRSEGFGAGSASGIASHELFTLQQKKENLNVSSQDTEDFIPLCSPEESDIEEARIDVDEGIEEKQIGLDMFLDNMSYIPVPNFLPSVQGQGYSQIKMDHLFASPHGSYRLNELLSKDGSENLKSRQPKGLYADNPKKRASVFSRLNFTSTHTASENQNDVSGKKLMNDVLFAKQQCHGEYEKMERVTRQKLECGGFCMEKRTSVFTRLASASEAVAERVHCMTGLKEGSGGWKKVRGKSILREWKQRVLGNDGF